MTIKIPESLPWVPNPESKAQVIVGHTSAGVPRVLLFHHEEEAAYAIHAANNYPALVRALEVIANPEQGDQPAHVLAARALKAAKGE